MNSKQKHPIDELFRKQLSHHSAETSDELRGRFLQMIEQKPKKKVWRLWYFSSAASILFLLGLTWFLYPDENQLAMTKNVKTEQKNEPLKTIIKNKDVSPQASSNNSKVDEKNVSNTKKEKVVNIESKNSDSNVAILELEIKNEETRNQNSITLSTEIESPLIENKIKIESFEQTIVIVTSELEKEIPRNAEPILEQEFEIVQIEKNTAAIEKEPKLANKVIRRLKYLKNGDPIEKIETEDIFENNEAKTFAKNEDSFLGHEAMEMRHRFKWLKGKFSKL